VRESTGSLLRIHAAVFLFGFAGLFGKWITLPALIIVFGRVVFASIVLLCAVLFLHLPLRLEKKSDYLFSGCLGAILALHWVSFFRSIQISTVAIGLLTYSTFPVFATFIEPVFFKHKLRFINVILALVAFAGVAFVIPAFELNDAVTRGALWGIVSGATFALLSILNRKMVKKYRSMKIALYQDATAAVILAPVFFILSPCVTAYDFILLAVLGAVFTGIAHALFIRGLFGLRAHRAGVIACLEPVYGILFAYLLLGERPSLRVLAGGAVILGVAFVASIRSAEGAREDG